MSAHGSEHRPHCDFVTTDDPQGVLEEPPLLPLLYRGVAAPVFFTLAETETGWRAEPCGYKPGLPCAASSSVASTIALFRRRWEHWWLDERRPPFNAFFLSPEGRFTELALACALAREGRLLVFQMLVPVLR